MTFETRKVWTSSRLPSLPLVGLGVLELSSQPEVTDQQYLSFLSKDKDFSQRLLTAANSPLTGASQEMANLGEVLSQLGTATLTSLSLMLCLQDTYVPADAADDLHVLAWQQAVVKGIAAGMLNSQVRDGLECEYFLAGLLLDMGRLAILHTVPEQHSELERTAIRDWTPIWDVEQKQLGLSTAELGGQLIEQWGFPPRLVQGILAQNAPLATLKELHGPEGCPLTNSLTLASALGNFLCGKQQALMLFRIRELAQGAISLNDSEMQQMLVRINQRYSEIAPVLGLENSPLPDLSELKGKAIEQLTKYCQRSSATTSGTTAAPSSPSSASPSASSATKSSVPNELNAKTVNPTSKPVTGAKPQSLEGMSIYCPLTKVHSRQYLEVALNKEVSRCSQAALPIGLAMIRIDRLESLKKQHGEAISNALLCHVGKVLKEMLRSSDTIGRLESDFAVIACDPTAKGMQRLADRIRGRITQQSMIWEGQSISITVCIGATLMLPKRSDSDLGGRILQAATKATETASKNGDNAIHFESLVDETELRRLFMANQFRFSRWLIAQGVLDIPRVAKALLEFKQRPARIGDLAVKQELLALNQVDSILKDQQTSQERFGQIAIRMGYLNEEQLIGLLILQHENPLRVAELFLSLGVLDQDKLHGMLKSYFETVPWAAPLSSAV